MKTKYLSIILATALTHTLSAQKDLSDSGAGGDAIVPEKKVESVEFEVQPGTTLGDFLKTNHEKLTKLNTSIVASAEAAKVKLPGFKVSLKDSAFHLTWLLQDITEAVLVSDSRFDQNKNEIKYYISFVKRETEFNEQKQVKIYALNFLQNSIPHLPSRSEQQKLEAARQREVNNKQKLGACKELITLSFRISELEEPAIQFHEATNTMIVNGNPKQQALIAQVIKSLK